MLTILAAVCPSPDQWSTVIAGMRNSWESWEKSDSVLHVLDHPEFGRIPYRYELGPLDQALGLRLGRLGGDHGKFLRQLPIHLTLRAPERWLKQLYTYRAGIEQVGVESTDLTINATSQMHTLGREPITAAMFSWEHVRETDRQLLLILLNMLRQEWVDAGKRKPGPEWLALQDALPQSWMYQLTISMNYQVARSMFHARQHHRLGEWHTFCAALAALDHAALITEP